MGSVSRPVRSARIVGITGVGKIEAGKAADMVLLLANPLEDIRNTRQISEVIVNGAFVDLQALDQHFDNLDIP